MKYTEAGTYHLHYTAVDDCGNETTETRGITVVATSIELAVFFATDNMLSVRIENLAFMELTDGDILDITLVSSGGATTNIEAIVHEDDGTYTKPYATKVYDPEWGGETKLTIYLPSTNTVGIIEIWKNDSQDYAWCIGKEVRTGTTVQVVKR